METFKTMGYEEFADSYLENAFDPEPLTTNEVLDMIAEQENYDREAAENLGQVIDPTAYTALRDNADRIAEIITKALKGG